MNRTVRYDPVQPRKAQSVHDFLAVRGKSGEYLKNLRCAFQEYRQSPTAVRLKVFGIHLLRMLCGDRLMNAALSDRAAVITGTYRADDADEGRLFHFAPADCVEEIMTRGLLPRRRFVYLTDAPKMLEQTFLPWKTGKIRATTADTLLCVDARQLSEEQKIYATDRAHEYVTGRIDAKHIHVVSDGVDASVT